MEFALGIICFISLLLNLIQLKQCNALETRLKQNWKLRERLYELEEKLKELGIYEV